MLKIFYLMLLFCSFNSIQLNAQVITIDSIIQKVEMLFHKYDESKDIKILNSIPHHLPSYISGENYKQDENWKKTRAKATTLYFKYFDELLKSGFDIKLDSDSIPCVSLNSVIVMGEEAKKRLEIRREKNEYHCEQLMKARSFEKASHRFNCFFKIHYRKRSDTFKVVSGLLDEYEIKSPQNKEAILKILRRSKRKLCWGMMKYK